MQLKSYRLKESRYRSCFFISDGEEAVLKTQDTHIILQSFLQFLLHCPQ